MRWFRITIILLVLMQIIMGSGCLIDTVGKAPKKTVYVVNNSYCTLCMLCVDPCPHNAIIILAKANGDTVLYIDDEKCVGCGECYEYCLYEALYTKDKSLE